MSNNLTLHFPRMSLQSVHKTRVVPRFCVLVPYVSGSGVGHLRTPKSENPNRVVTRLRSVSEDSGVDYTPQRERRGSSVKENTFSENLGNKERYNLLSNINMETRKSLDTKKIPPPLLLREKIIYSRRSNTESKVEYRLRDNTDFCLTHFRPLCGKSERSLRIPFRKKGRNIVIMSRTSSHHGRCIILES